MKKLRYVLAGMLMLGLAIPAVTLADDDDDSDKRRRCSSIGPWLGVVSPDNPIFTGVMWTEMGKSEKRGTIVVEQLNNPDPTLGGLFPDAVRTSTFRGNWHRIGNRKFVYTLTGYAVDLANQIVGIVKFKGDATLTRDCQYEYVTAMHDLYYPWMSPFDDDPFMTISFPDQWGRRAHVELR